MNDLTHTFPVFKGKTIRRQLHQNEWWFSVIDVIEALTDSSIPRRYWTDLKRKLAEEEGYFELYEKIVQAPVSRPRLKKLT